VAPAGREDLGAGAVLGGEEGDDVAEDGVGEVADAIGASSIFMPLVLKRCFYLMRSKFCTYRYSSR
jgi:hypothetical protein